MKCDIDEVARETILQEYAAVSLLVRQFLAFHESLITTVRKGIIASCAWESLSQTLELCGGFSRSGLHNSGSLAGYRWVVFTGVPDYAFAIWIHVADRKTGPGIAVHMYMNPRMSGVSGRLFRKDVAGLPDGDSSKWISQGRIQQVIEASPEHRISIEDLCPQAVSVASQHLVFTERLCKQLAAPQLRQTV